MSLISVDTSNEGSERPAFKPLEPGTYDLEIVNDLVTAPAKSGSQYEVIALELKELETGKIIRDWISLNPTADWKKNQFVKAVGVEPDANGNVDLMDFKGQYVRATVTQKTRKKQDSDEIMLFNDIKAYLYE